MNRRMAATLVAGAALAALAPTERAAAQSESVTPKTQAPSEARVLSRAFSAVAKALQPSVVRLDVESERSAQAQGDRRQVPPELERFFERFFGDELPMPNPGRGTGSGVVLDAKGNILTNSHVVENAAKVTVTLSDGREMGAQVVGRDPNTDLAVVRLTKPPAGLVAARLGDSSKIEVGEWALAIGSPLGLDQSVTVGIISGKGRVGRNVHLGTAARIREYIQTDAKINPGNSGGPLVNLDGEVVGINMMINTGPGGAYGFAIPINQARRVAQTIISDGRVRHAYLGVYLGDVKDGVRLGPDSQADRSQGTRPVEKGPPRAAWVTEVTPGSPAQKAGVRPGDVITRIDGRPIEAAADVVDTVSSRTVGEKVTLAYLRDGKTGSAVVTLGELPSQLDEQASETESGLGLSLQTLTAEMARYLGVPPTTKGAAVSEVMPGSRAARAGLRAEDVIIEVDRKPTTDAAQASAALKRKGGHLLRIRRRGAALYLTLPEK